MNVTAHKTVPHAFLDRVVKTPNARAVHLIERTKEEFALSYLDLYQLASRIVHGLQKQGIAKGDRLVIALSTSRDFFGVYLACLFSGMIPVIIAGPKPNRPAVAYAGQLSALASTIDSKTIIISEPDYQVLKPHLSAVAVTVAELSGDNQCSNLDIMVDDLDVAHLQATSGSTGSPKLAIVRHSNIVANIQAIAGAIKHRSDEVLVSWLPFYHDMGLIGLAYTLYWQCPMIASDPVNFVYNPLSWLQWISRFGGTLSPAPNSAFQICARLARMRPPTDLNLSSWRVALCGSEPVSAHTIQQFQAVFSSFGFRETAMFPVYGLAEATLAVTIPELNKAPRVEYIDADLLASANLCLPLAPTEPQSLPMVAVGSVVPKHQLRVVDAQGKAVAARVSGEIEFSGPSVIDGYWENQQATEDLKRADGFLRTGDLGYLADGQLYITGRQKDIIIINGRNYIPNQLETFVESLIHSHIAMSVVAFGEQNTERMTETLHLLLDLRLALEYDQHTLEEQIRNGLEEVFGLSGIGIYWVAAGQIPKTDNGKIQRHRCRELIRGQ